MFKKLMLALFLIVGLAACGSTPSEASKSVDLSGTWTMPDSDTTFGMEAQIANETIQVFWLSENTKALYWQGTLPTASDVEDGEIIVSMADKAALENAFLASSADKKPFTYKAEMLSFDFTIQGITETIYLERA